MVAVGGVEDGTAVSLEDGFAAGHAVIVLRQTHARASCLPLGPEVGDDVIVERADSRPASPHAGNFRDLTQVGPPASVRQMGLSTVADGDTLTVFFPVCPGRRAWRGYLVLGVSTLTLS